MLTPFSSNSDHGRLSYSRRVWSVGSQRLTVHQPPRRRDSDLDQRSYTGTELFRYRVSSWHWCTSAVISWTTSILFVRIAPVPAVIYSFSVSHHQYAVDMQIYIAVSKADVVDKAGLLVFTRDFNGLQLNHWLMVQYCVSFKTASLVFSIKNTGQPAYLRDLVQDYEPVRTLRSSSKNSICKSYVSTALAFCGFRHLAASVWNSWSNSIRDAKTCVIFKRRLGTHLCEIAFGT